MRSIIDEQDIPEPQWTKESAQYVTIDSDKDLEKAFQTIRASKKKYGLKRLEYFLTHDFKKGVNP